MKRSEIWLPFAATLMATLGNPCAAQTPEEFYAKQTVVNLVVGLEAGGGYDIYARLLARHLGRHLNGATVVVQNMTGAGSLRAVNHIYNVAPRNGTVLGTFVSGVAFRASVRQPGRALQDDRFQLGRQHQCRSVDLPGLAFRPGAAI